VEAGKKVPESELEHTIAVSQSVQTKDVRRIAAQVAISLAEVT
jgi:hypothetical protein